MNSLVTSTLAVRVTAYVEHDDIDYNGIMKTTMSVSRTYNDFRDYCNVENTLNRYNDNDNDNDSVSNRYHDGNHNHSHNDDDDDDDDDDDVYNDYKDDSSNINNVTLEPFSFSNR